MKLSHKIRKIWHDVYYKNSSKKRTEFALKCKNVTAEIDLRAKPQSVADHFRFWLHLSLCQACKNYYDVSKVLSKAIRKQSSAPTTDLNRLNKQLLEKYSTKK